MSNIRLNFIPFNSQELGLSVYRKKFFTTEYDESSFYYDLPDENDVRSKYEIKFEECNGFERYNLEPFHNHHLIAKKIYSDLVQKLAPSFYFIKSTSFKNCRIHIVLQKHQKGTKCIWVEPYFLKSKQLWGLLLDYAFVVSHNEQGNAKFKLDKEILIASGTLNEKGHSNLDYYLFKHNYIQQFLRDFLPDVNRILENKLISELLEIECQQLNTKTYVFGHNATSSSSFLGLSKNSPLENIKGDLFFYFIYKKEDRDIAVTLLKGLRGDTFPTTFSGMERLFKLSFSNEKIKGSAIESYSSETISAQIQAIKEIGGNVIPIVITNSKENENDERLYYQLKHKFTKAGIPCQIVTKELVMNEMSLKYSLSNIGLQIFAKAGGKPWRMKPATNEYLIIGIGQSYHIVKTANGNSIEKNLTYSVLTDSSGLFKDIKVIAEGVESDESYSTQLVSNISTIIKTSGYKKVSIHVPFRLSKEKILQQVVKGIGFDTELTVLVINIKNSYFGFDYGNNALVPFESTYSKIAKDEFLVWFEGLQYNNPKINKRFGNPLLIKFWFTNRAELFKDYTYKENLLQDCINLSGANWRGFKAKQLPVSVFYCQRIAEFIGKFQQYNLDQIEIDNLKPWFL